MQGRFAEELRSLQIDQEDAPVSRPEVRGGIGYSTSIQRVVAGSFEATSASLVFPSSRGSSYASSITSRSSTSSVGAPAAPPSYYRQQLMEALPELNEIASHMVNDGYTNGLIMEFSRIQDCGGGDAILRTWFSELGVDWVFGFTKSKLQEEQWSAVEDMVKQWVAAFSVMTEALQLTRTGLCSDDGSGGSVFPLSETAPRSAPPTVSAVSADSSDLNLESSDSASHGRFVVASVKEAIIAYSADQKGRFFGLGGQEEAWLQNQFALFAEASLMKMLRFPIDVVAVAALKRSPEKILCMIDMYSVVSDALSDLLPLLPGGEHNPVSDRIRGLLWDMSEEASRILDNLKGLVREEKSSWKGPGSDDIHPVNKYVLNYTNLLLENSTVLDSMLSRAYIHRAISPKPNPNTASILAELINLLLKMLDVKSKEYSTARRGYIFLLNNGYFILQEIEKFLGSPIEENCETHIIGDLFEDLFKKNCEPEQHMLLGEPRIQQFREPCRGPPIQQYIDGYLNTAWGPLTDWLNKDHGKSRFLKVWALKEYKEKLQVTYNKEKFVGIHSPRLRRSLRELVSSKVISAYRAYLNIHALNETSTPYTIKDLEDLFEDLFEG